MSANHVGGLVPVLQRRLLPKSRSINEGKGRCTKHSFSYSDLTSTFIPCQDGWSIPCLRHECGSGRSSLTWALRRWSYELEVCWGVVDGLDTWCRRRQGADFRRSSIPCCRRTYSTAWSTFLASYVGRRYHHGCPPRSFQGMASTLRWYNGVENDTSAATSLWSRRDGSRIGWTCSRLGRLSTTYLRELLRCFGRSGDA